MRRWNVVLVGVGAVVALLPFSARAQSIELKLPIDCEVGRSCAIQHYVDHDPSPKAMDYMCGTLTYDRHDGTDFRIITTAAQHSGVDVLAAANGQVERVRDGVADALKGSPSTTTPEDRACGNGLIIKHMDGWETQYCHLARGSLRVRPGDLVRTGQPVGRVGFSGRTEFPHLHFTVRQNGQVVDPFAFGASDGSCGAGVMLWSASLRASLTYRERVVLNTGFATGPVTMEQIENGVAGQEKVGPNAPALVAFVRAIGLKEGDVQRLSVRTPDGRILADHEEKPLDRNKAQYMMFTGKKAPAEGWPNGTYQATYMVSREGKVLLEHAFSLSF